MAGEPSDPRPVRVPAWRSKPARALASLLVGALAVAALLYVAPLEEVWHQIERMSPGWVAAAVACELASCLSYVILFRRVFPEPPPGVGRQVAWMAMGAGAVLPGGNISSAAATGVLLRNHGIGVRPLVARCAALLCLLTAFGFLVNGAAGVLLLLGVPGGPHDVSHAGVPILVSVVTLSGAGLTVVWARRLGPGAPGRCAGSPRACAGPGRRCLSRTGGCSAAPASSCSTSARCGRPARATGHHLGPLAVIIAYCIGYLATTIPMPAGLGVLDSGLAAALVLYGMDPAASVGAVLVYHAISIWVPGAGGLLAWLPTRRLVARRVRRESRRWPSPRAGRRRRRRPLIRESGCGWQHLSTPYVANCCQPEWRAPKPRPAGRGGGGVRSPR